MNDSPDCCTILWRLLGYLCIVNCKLESGPSDNGAGLVNSYSGPHTTFVLQRSSKSALFWSFLLHQRLLTARLGWSLPWLAVIGSSLGASQCVFAQPAKWNIIFSGKVLPAGLQDTVILLSSQILQYSPVTSQVSGTHQHTRVFSRVPRIHSVTTWADKWVTGVRWPALVSDW